MKPSRRHPLSKPTRPPPPPLNVRQALTSSERESLAQKMQEAYHWTEEPRPHQLIGVLAQIEGVDTIIQAPTGSGKTAIAAGPHLWLPGMITLMICPLLALEDEMVKTFQTDFGLKATAINGQNGALSGDKVKVRLLSSETCRHRSHFLLEMSGYPVGHVPDCFNLTRDGSVSDICQSSPSQPHVRSQDPLCVC